MEEKISALRPKAKAVVLECENDEAQVLRIVGNKTFGFGFQLRATRKGVNQFVDAIEAIGLTADFNHSFKVDRGVRIYEMYLRIPNDWIPPKS